MSNLEKPKSYVWETKLPEIKKIVEGAKIVKCRQKNPFTYTFTLDEFDEVSSEKLRNLIRNMLLQVDFSSHASSERELFEMELAISCEITGMHGAKTYHVFEGFQDEVNAVLLNIISDFNNKKPSSEVGDILGRVRQSMPNVYKKKSE